jgi:hypothetical protein
MRVTSTAMDAVIRAITVAALTGAATLCVATLCFAAGSV